MKVIISSVLFLQHNTIAWKWSCRLHLTGDCLNNHGGSFARICSRFMKKNIKDKSIEMDRPAIVGKV